MPRVKDILNGSAEDCGGPNKPPCSGDRPVYPGTQEYARAHHNSGGTMRRIGEEDFKSYLPEIIIGDRSDEKFFSSLSDDFFRKRYTGDETNPLQYTQEDLDLLKDIKGKAPRSIGVRQNNPSNLVYKGQSNANKVEGSRFASFDNLFQGYEATMADLNLKKAGKSKTDLTENSTMLQLIQKWAPESDNNDPLGYAGFISRETGIPVDTKIKNIDMKVIAPYIARKEGIPKQVAEAMGRAYELKNKAKNDSKYYVIQDGNITGVDITPEDMLKNGASLQEVRDFTRNSNDLKHNVYLDSLSEQDRDVLGGYMFFTERLDGKQKHEEIE